MSQIKVSSTFSKMDPPSVPIKFLACYPIVDGYNSVKEINSDYIIVKQKDKLSQDNAK